MSATRVLLVGLGNYSFPKTRHNAGMMVLDHLAALLELDWTHKRPWKALVAQTTLSFGDTQQHQFDLTLLKPRVLMNVSGQSVAPAVRDLAISPSNLYIFHDDMQRSLGKVSLKEGGSANGHNGIKSVIGKLGKDEFWRVRIGIGRPEDQRDVVDYVLDKFPSNEMEILRSAVYPFVSAGPGEGLENLLVSHKLGMCSKPPAPKKKKRKNTEPSEEATTTTVEAGAGAATRIE
ncbi:peptidyl-tRNA hydrolase-domain-containing protein [Syncephalastrum racemosum]|uniref:Peptidyl-tRNA hydrolase n=1 Tax=Syncephalastrum racemosum TaxID=13706 RepID=A0A1X2HFK2_SYNRA|nr:peptidyl-tRNA hydrolase-domain-containing protein [Syncephalastrum racemosum]